MVGHNVHMKILASSAAALAMLVLAVPAFAQNHDDHQQGHGQMSHGQMGHAPMRHAPPPRHSYHEGQNYHGHHLTNHNGHWGYYQPRGGSQIFISIPL